MQPSIVFAFVEQTASRAGAPQAEVAARVAAAVHAVLERVWRHGLSAVAPPDRRRAVAVTFPLMAGSDAVYAACVAEWQARAETSAELFADFATSAVVPRLADGGGGGGAGGGDGLAELEAFISTLARLFIANPKQWTAFREVAGLVFTPTGLLKLGSPPRAHVNELLLHGDGFDERLKPLVCETDAFVSAPFFWNDTVMPLFTRALIAKRFPALNGCVRTEKAADGSAVELHLYSRLLALLLRLSSLRGGDNAEIARRVLEVLDQLERNADQQAFLLTILHVLEARCEATPSAFDSLPLTVLAEVCANGVQTISSVSAKGGDAR